jgi:hypothetical protein
MSLWKTFREVSWEKLLQKSFRFSHTSLPHGWRTLPVSRKLMHNCGDKKIMKTQFLTEAFLKYLIVPSTSKTNEQLLSIPGNLMSSRRKKPTFYKCKLSQKDSFLCIINGRMSFNFKC